MRERRRSNLLVVYLSVILCFLCGSLSAQVLQEAVPSRITSPVDNAVRVTIARSTHPQAQARFDRGPLDPSSPMERMILVLGASPEQEQQLRTFLDSQQTKGSPDYHHWLTPAEFGQKFGPSPQDIQQVTGWMQQQGFSVGSVARSGRWIEFSGSAAQVNRAFQTQMRNYQVAGESHLANASDISVPAALAPVVRGVSLHNFFKKPMLTEGQKVTLRPDATLHDKQGNVVHALSPGDFAIIYDLNALYNSTPTPLNGAGQTIAIVARSDIDPNDINAFHSQFATGSSVNPILNGPDPGLVPGDQDEATLDSEWSSAVAPGARIDLVVSSSTATTDGVDLSAAYIVDNNLADVMSASFSQCERLLGAPENAFINGLWEQAAAQGISVFVAAGDDGAAGCDDPTVAPATGGVAVSGLASTPFNTAVGGTEFDESLGGGDATFWNTTNTTTLVSVKGYIPEMVWNESCSATTCGLAGANLFAGSGGVSTIYPTPSWQASTGIPGLNFPMRALPDVSLTAAGHDGYLVCLQASCQQSSFFVFGGTSASSPSFAGIMAIIDQKTGGRQGLPNYVLYSLAAKSGNFSNCNSSSRMIPGTQTSCIFNDSTVGNNSVPGQTGFNAVTGYDLATGLGSVDVNNLVNAWSLASFTGTTVMLAANPALNPITIAHGSPLNFNVSVARMSGTGTPSGTVSLVASGGTLPTASVGVAATTISPGSPVGTASGTFTGISNLPGGAAYNLKAHYPGDGTFAANDSTALTVTVMPENSTTTLASIISFDNLGNPIFGTNIAYGDFLDLRSVVASAGNTSPPDGFPSGTITINDNGTPIGTLKLNSGGQAELINCITPAPSAAPCLAPGSHPITVAYGGDLGFNPSGPTAATTITVTTATPKAVLSSAQATIASGQGVDLAVLFQIGNGLAPTGTVRFFDGTTLIGTSNAGTPSLHATLTTQGVHNLTAQYLGDSNYNPATSNAVAVTVNAPFNFTATTTSQTIAAGGTATYNLTLNDITGFAGSVSLACTGAPGGATCTGSPNPATLTNTTTSVPLTVTVSNTTSARLAPAPFKTWPFVVAGMLAGLLWSRKKKAGQALLILVAFGAVLGIGSCGGGGSPPPRPPTVATLTVTATSGQFTSNITLDLTITH